MIWTILVILAVVGLDQWTKLLALSHLRQVKTFPLIENILHFTYVENRGAAFGMLANHRWVFMAFSLLAIVAIFVWLWWQKPKSVWLRLAAAFIVGGGIGNMIDRFARGFVVDFIDVRCINFYVFNVADSFVCVGCAMFFLWVLRSEIAEKKKKQAEGEAQSGESGDGNDANVTQSADTSAYDMDAAADENVPVDPPKEDAK